MKPFNQFDMEQQIMNCWNVCEDLDTLMEGVLERDMTRDRITNALMGMKELYQLKFETLWEQFEAMLDQKREDQFHKLWNPSETSYADYERDDNMGVDSTARGDNMGVDSTARGEVL